MVRVTVRKHGQPLHVFCTHMGLRDEMRSRHAAEILLIMSRFTDAPRILLGDFNEGRGSTGVESIAEEFNDIWAKYGIGQEKTYSSIAPVRRIDFIWADKELAATSCYAAKFSETNTASDHLPVFAHLLKPSDLHHTVQEITVQLNGKEIQSATQIVTASPPCEVDLDTVLHAITSSFACEAEYENSLVKILHPVYDQNLAGTLPGQMPAGWTQSHRSAGVTPFGGVILIGTCKLCCQRSEQHLSFHHVLPTSPSLTEFEVSARLKTMATGGGAWQLEAVTTSSRPPHNSYSIEVSHNGRHLPRLRLMTGEQELETLNLSDFQIDPYDWNHYALALTRQSMENGETTTCLTVYINGRRIAKALDVEAGRNAKDYFTTTSIVLTTTGRHDAACEVYAENIMIRKWKTAQEPDPTSETGYQILIRSFPPNTSIIESQFEPSSRWRGFF